MEYVFVVRDDVYLNVLCITETRESAMDYLLTHGYIDSAIIEDICDSFGKKAPNNVDDFVYGLSEEEFNHFFFNSYSIFKIKLYKREVK